MDYQASLSMGFSRQEYKSGLPFPSPGDLPDPGIEPGLPHCGQTLHPLSHQGSCAAVLPLQGLRQQFTLTEQHKVPGSS